MRILVTGGCGFIGTRYVAYALSVGHTIRVLDDFSTGSVAALADSTGLDEGSLEAKVEVIEADVRSPGAVQDAAKGVDAIVHLAANAGVPQSVADPRRDFEVNAGGTFNVLEAARAVGVDRVVAASSGAPVGDVQPPVHEETAAHPKSPYGASKLAGEGYCSAFYRCYGVHAVALRFSNVYGPGSWRKGSVVAKFIRSALNGDPVEVFGDGEQTRDFLFVDDLILAIERALVADCGGETVQIATGREVSVNNLIDELRKLVPELSVVYGERRVGDVTRNYADPQKALTILDWQAHIAFQEGLKQTVDWFLVHRATQ